MRYESIIKPKTCPKCGSNRVADIYYRKPSTSALEKAKKAKGLIVFGGCSVTGDDPSWRCVTCKAEIHSTL